jgi:hypothetical protein
VATKRILQFHRRLVEVDDVDALLLIEDVGRHVGMPFALQVTEVHACIEQLFEFQTGHCPN